MIAGAALDIIGFPANAVPGNIGADTIFALGIVDAPFDMPFGLLGACCYAGYHIDRKRHAEIQATLAARDERSRQASGYS